MKSLPTLDLAIATAVVQDQLDAPTFARLVTERYPDGFILDTTPGLRTPEQHIKLRAMMRESVQYMTPMPPTETSMLLSSIMEDLLAGRLTPEAAAEQLYRADTAVGFAVGELSRRKGRKVQRMMKRLLWLHGTQHQNQGDSP